MARRYKGILFNTRCYVQALWSLCCHHNPDFVWDYVAYQHLKAKVQLCLMHDC